MSTKTAKDQSRHVKALRKRLGLSQEAFAQRLGVSLFSVSKWENGHFRPSRLAQKQIDLLERDLTSHN